MILKQEEQLALTLRNRFEQYGYRPFKMGKFEEYEFYVRNKESLISEGVLTFTDLSGKLMALKPDVTLSIIKQARDDDGAVQKVYYNENVYRVSPEAGCFKEIPQMGLECLGDIDPACVYEVIRLAADSLAAIDPGAVLDITHLGLIDQLLSPLPRDTAGQICTLLEQKNTHELQALCTRMQLPEQLQKVLCTLPTLYGTPDTVLPRLKELFPASRALEELEALLALFPGEQMLRIDPAATEDMSYYNGFIFKGFVPGVPETVLSGGCYDQLMQRLGHRGHAIGFALYLDRLERASTAPAPMDADILLLYDKDADMAALQQAAATLRQQGSVMLQKALPRELRFGRVLRFNQGRVEEL